MWGLSSVHTARLSFLLGPVPFSPTLRAHFLVRDFVWFVAVSIAASTGPERFPEQIQEFRTLVFGKGVRARRGSLPPFSLQKELGPHPLEFFKVGVWVLGSQNMQSLPEPLIDLQSCLSPSFLQGVRAVFLSRICFTALTSI